MNQKQQLEQLTKLRKMRVRIAQEAAARQRAIQIRSEHEYQNICTEIEQNAQSRQARETSIYEQLSEQPAEHSELNQILDALTFLEARSARLEQVKRSTKDTLKTETERTEALNKAHYKQLRKLDRLQLLIDHEAKRSDQEKLTIIELDEDERITPPRSS